MRRYRGTSLLGPTTLIGVVCALVVGAAVSCQGHQPDQKQSSRSPEGSVDRDHPEGPRPVLGSELPEEFRSKALRIPRSNAMVPWERDDDRVLVNVTAKDIRVGGESVVAVPIPDSAITEDDESGLQIAQITPVSERLAKLNDSPEGESGKLSLAVDRWTRYRLIVRATYSAGEALYSNIRYIVSGRKGEKAYYVQLRSPKSLRAPSAHPCKPPRSWSNEMPPGGRPGQILAYGAERLVDQDAKSLGSSGCQGVWRDFHDPESSSREPLYMTVSVDHDGILLGAKGSGLPPREGCQESGPTLCLRDDEIDVEKKLERAYQLRRESGAEARRRLIELRRQLLRAYDWGRLYEELVELKRDDPSAVIVQVTADPAIPFLLLARAIDVARFRLERDTFAGAEAFRDAFWSGRRRYRSAGNTTYPEILFSQPIFVIAK